MRVSYHICNFPATARIAQDFVLAFVDYDGILSQWFIVSFYDNMVETETNEALIGGERGRYRIFTEMIVPVFLPFSGQKSASGTVECPGCTS